MSKQSQKPSVKYHTIVSVDQNGNIKTNNNNDRNNLLIYNVIKVINGTLESVLHLIGYSFMQMRKINREFSIRYDTEQNREFILSIFENEIESGIKNSRPSGAHIVEYDNILYGVIIDGGIARICGHINRVIPFLQNNNNSLDEKGVKINRSSNGDNWLLCGKEVRHHIENDKHIISVSEKGALFVVPNSDCTGHQFDVKLLLVLEHGFVIIDELEQIPVHYIRTKQALREEQRMSSQLLKEESMFIAIAAIAIGKNDFKVYGYGSIVNIKNIQQISDPI